MIARDKFTGVNSITFNNSFKEDSDCYEYLSLVKWEAGFVCRKCNNDKYYKGEKPFSRRCLKCKYDESPTVNTGGSILKILKISAGLSIKSLNLMV